MRGVSQIVLVLLILVIAISVISFLWLSFYSIFGKVASSGNTSTLGNALSSCMNIDSVKDNEVYLRNCGDGTITNSSLRVYFDNAPANFSMTSASLRKGEIGIITLYGLLGLNAGENYKLKITSPSGEVERYVKVISTDSLPDEGVLNLKFDEGSGNITYDSSDYSNNGYLQNIYPLDVIAGNPSLESPWSLAGQADVNHITRQPDKWAADTSFYNLSTSIMLGLEETSIVKDGSYAFNMTFKSIGSYYAGMCLLDYNAPNIFPINESQYLEGGNFQYPIRGLSIYGGWRQSFVFFNSTGDKLSRRYATTFADLESDVGGGWHIKSYVWQPSSGDPNPPTTEGDIPYIPKGAKYAGFFQYFVYQPTDVDYNALFDKFFIYQWPSMPSNYQRISRASSGWVNGKYAKAISFDGYNDYINVTSSDSLNITGNITLMAWVYPNNLTGWSSLIEKDQNGGYRLGFNNSNPAFTLYGLWNASATGTIPLNQWSHIAATYDRQNVKIYINGVLNTTIPHTDSIGIGTSPVIIGKRGSGADYFNGIIDEVSVWNRTLTQQEIQTVMNGGQIVTGGTPSLTLEETT